MAMQTDVKAISLAASGDISAYPTRVRGLVVEPGASAGSVIIKDGGTGGTTLFTINTIAGGETFKYEPGLLDKGRPEQPVGRRLTRGGTRHGRG